MTMSVDCPECGESAERFFTQPSPPMFTLMTEQQGKEWTRFTTTVSGCTTISNRQKVRAREHEPER